MLRKNPVSRDLSFLLDKKDLESQSPELRKICQSLFFKGKGLRSQLTSLVGSCLCLDQKKKLLLSRIVEYIHNSSLLHDDFIDHCRFRRNQKTAWLAFSPAQAVLAGDYLLAKVNIYLAQEKNLNLIKKTAQAICELAAGEFLQRELILSRNKSLKKRDRVSELKTAGLFKWCLQAPFLLKKRESVSLSRQLESIGFRIGLLFQRSDDLMDFSIRNQDKKPFFSDLKQKYLNSFACFLLRGASSKKAQDLLSARSLSHVQNLFPNLHKKVEAFDKINEQIITEGKKDIQELKPLLKKKEQDLIPELKAFLSYFYWRK